MGAWGVGAFENDTALDWLADFDDEGADAIVEALETVGEADADAFVDVDEASCALAAAELVAALKTGDTSRLPDTAVTSLASYRDDIVVADLRRLALGAISRIKSDSELNDLWRDSDDHDDWTSELDALVDRLR